MTAALTPEARAREAEISISREQAEAFYETLWPCGHMAHLDNPTRTFLSALVGRIPQSRPYHANDAEMVRMRKIAAILHGVADHLALSLSEATLTEKSDER